MIVLSGKIHHGTLLFKKVRRTPQYCLLLSRHMLEETAFLENRRSVRGSGHQVGTGPGEG